MQEVMTAEQSATPVETVFPVDLTREEFVDYHMLMAKLSGTMRMQKPMIFGCFVFAAIYMCFFAFDIIRQGVWYWPYPVGSLLIIVLAVLMAIMLPRRVRKNAGKLYDQGNIDGYYGLLHISETAVTKETADGNVTVPLRTSSGYLEDAGLMVFFAANSPKAIILPARCLTEQDAALLRRRVFAPEITMNRQVKNRMQPTAAAHIPARQMAAEPTELMLLDVTYTQQELQALATDSGLRKYTQQLPVVAALAAVFGMLMGLLEESWILGGIIALCMMLAMLALAALSGRMRVKHVLTASPSAARARIRLTDRGLTVQAGDAPAPGYVTWGSIDRAVEKPDCIEFTAGIQLLRIPKRCVEDVAALRSIVDTYRKKK